MRIHHDRIAGIFLALFSGTALAYAFTFPSAAGLYVKIISAIMLVLSVALWARTFHVSERKKIFDKFFAHPRGLALTVIATLIYFIAVDVLGFYTATAIFVPALASLAGYQHMQGMITGTMIYLCFVFIVFGLTFNKAVTPELILSLFR